MKKSSKILLIISVSLIIIGVILAVVGIAMGAGTSYNFDFKNGLAVSGSFAQFEEKENFEIPTEIENINIYQKTNGKINNDALATEIKIIEGDKFSIIYRTNNENSTLTHEIDGDKIIINQETKSENNNFISFLNFQDRDGEIIITVPKDQNIKMIKINSEIGDIEVNSITAEGLAVTCDVGNIDIEYCNINSTAISTDVGNIETSDSTLGFAMINANVGNLEIENSALQELICSADIGNIEINVNGNAGEYSAQTTVDLGSAEIDKGILNTLTENTNQITAQANMGNIEITLN